MRFYRARLARMTRRDDGMTLVELSVSCLVLAIVMTSVGVLVFGANRLNSGNSARLEQVSQGRIALDAMTRTLRTAVLPSQLGAVCASGAAADDPSCATAAFVLGTSTSVQFYANIDNENNLIGPSKVTYTISNGTLVETVQRPNPHAPTVFTYSYCTPSPTCAVRTRTLARGVETTAPVFTYYDATPTKITTATLTAADLAKVDSIEVGVTVKKAGKVKVRPTTFVQRVALPNADAVVRIETS
jgi:Tfp pilus assembly protein PilW